MSERGQSEDNEEEEEEEVAGPEMGTNIDKVNVSGGSGIHVGNKVNVYQYLIFGDPENLDLLKLTGMDNAPLMINGRNDFQETQPPINNIPAILGLTRRNGSAKEFTDGREAISQSSEAGTFSGGQEPVITLPLDDENVHNPNISEVHSENVEANPSVEELNQPKESSADVIEEVHSENVEANPSVEELNQPKELSADVIQEVHAENVEANPCVEELNQPKESSADVFQEVHAENVEANQCVEELNQSNESSEDDNEDEENNEETPSTSCSVALLSPVLNNVSGEMISSREECLPEASSAWWNDMFPVSARETIVFNEFVDRLLVSVRDEVIKQGETTADLPDLNCPISVKVWGPITLKGVFTTEKGHVGDLSTIYRSDDVIISVDDESLCLGIHMGVKCIAASAKYKLHFANNYSEGLLSIRCPSCLVSAVVSAGKKSFGKFRLLHFCIEEMGKLTVLTEGQGLFNKVAGPTITVIWNQFGHLIKHGLSIALRKALKRAIRRLDKLTLKIEYNPEEEDTESE